MKKIPAPPPKKKKKEKVLGKWSTYDEKISLSVDSDLIHKSNILARVKIIVIKR